MKQLIPAYACRKAWLLRHEDNVERNPDRIWIVLGIEGIETHIGTSEKYLDKDEKEQIKYKGIKFITKY